MKHQVVLWVLGIGKDKGKEERTKENVISQGGVDQNQNQTWNSSIVERKDMWRKIVSWERKRKDDNKVICKKQM